MRHGEHLKFINCQQYITDGDGKEIASHIDIMEQTGLTHCRLSLYPNENAIILSSVYVVSNVRHQGYCNEMLDYIDNSFRKIRDFVIVYVDSWAPEYVVNMYKKRGYVVLNTGN